MSAIHIRRTLDSDTLHLPELKPLIGKAVEITITEAPAVENTKDWSALEEAARELTDYDFDLPMRYREFDRQHNTSPDL
jgi:hypothetical protein